MHPAAPPPPPTQLDALTGLRFVAAAAVMVSHVPQWFAVGEFHPGPLGSAAVGLFFALSGFVLSHVYRGAWATTSVRRFLLARFARIWPLHLVCLSLVFVAPGFQGAPTNGEEWRSLSLHACLLQAWTTDIRFAHSWNAPAWSLSVEAFFYLLFPLLAARGDRWLFALLGLGLAALVSLYAFADAAVLADPSCVEAWKTTFSTMPVSRLPEFVAGMCAHAVWRRRLAAHPPSFLAATSLELGAVALFVLLYRTWGAGQWGPALATSDGRPVSIEALSRGPGLSLAAAALVAVLAVGRGLLARLLANAWAVYLGEISYAFYLVHSIVLGFSTGSARDFPLAWQQPLLASALLAIGVSALLFAGVETPMRRMLLAKEKGLVARGRVFVATVREETRRRTFWVAAVLGLVGLGLPIAHPITPHRYVDSVIGASAPQARDARMTDACTVLGAEAHVHDLRFATAAAIEGEVPDGAEFRFVALTKDGRVVHVLAHASADTEGDGERPRRLLRARSDLGPLAGASVLQLRLCAKGAAGSDAWPGSSAVEVYRLPW